MAAHVSPSPIIDYFVRELSGSMPDDERSKLDAYTDVIATTTHEGDARRAWHCADWALTLDRDTPASHEHRICEKLHEEHRLWKDTILGAEFGVLNPAVGPDTDIEIQWVDDAVAMARTVADASGWAAVPWEDLLQDMLGMEPSA